MMYWHIVTSAEYKLGNKVAGDMYFLSDTKEIYRGAVPFTESVVLYNATLPTESIAKNRLYIDSSSLAGYIHDGENWTKVIKAVTDTVTAEGTDPVSGKAVAAYVAAQMAGMTASTVIASLSWDAAEHMLTATKGDSTTQEIVFDGLGCSLSYVASTGTLQMLDASGNQIGDAVELAKDKFVTSGEYNPETKKIILYFDAEKTNYVEIDAAALVDVYTGEDSTSVSVAVSADNKIKATVKISTAAGNVLEVKEDGLYAAIDTSALMDKVPEAVEGNIATFGTDGQVVDSGKSFADLASNAKVFKGASIDEAVGEETPAQGDFCIVEKQIGESERKELTAYYYDGTNWVAFDGNYSAENVYFPADLTTTSAIGNVTLTNGQATINAAGKNIVEVWNKIFVKESNPKTTQPTVSVTLNQKGTYEVGTNVTPTYTATLNPGSYTYGPATGITAKKWEVSNTDGGTASTNAGTFDAIQVTDTTNYTVTAKAEYDAGAIPVTNTGNEYAAGQIAAGSKSGTSAAIKGFRKSFWGYRTTAVDISTIDSDMIRALQNSSTAAFANGSKGSVAYPAGTKAVIIAYPATLRDLSSVIDVGGMNAEIAKAHDTTVDVKGANDYEAISYKVTVYAFAGDGASAANTYNFTV